MANDIDNAIARLQSLALQCSSVTIKAAPTYPVEDAGVLPLAIAHLSSGNVNPSDATMARIFPTINVDFHFSRVSLRQAYAQIDAIVQEYSKRLCGDPTLNGNVASIVFPVQFNITPAKWDSVFTQMLSFTIPLKILDAPTASM